MVNRNVKRLLYRGTTDGFGPSAFHSRCDGKSNTVTIILNDQNYVFGGYTSVPWHSYNLYSNDPNAYLFSLRRDQSTNSEKYLIRPPHSPYAIYGGSVYMPTFGYAGHDIYICPNANITKCCGNTKTSYGIRNDNFLAGANNRDWLVTEIEVYQLE